MAEEDKRDGGFKPFRVARIAFFHTPPTTRRGAKRVTAQPRSGDIFSYVRPAPVFEPAPVNYCSLLLPRSVFSVSGVRMPVAMMRSLSSTSAIWMLASSCLFHSGRMLWISSFDSAPP